MKPAQTTEKVKQDKNLNLEPPSAWCPLPWSHINIRSSGTYRLCCHSNTSATQGTLRDKNQKALHVLSSNVSSAMNSETMKSIRKNMLKGEWSKECVRCQREFETGMNSRNRYERQVLSHLAKESYPNYLKTKEKTKEDGSIDLEDFPLLYLDARFGNLCNLKCIMCGPADSSKWYEDHQQLTGKDYFYDSGAKVQLYEKNKTWKTEKNIYSWSDQSVFWRDIEKYMGSLRKLYIVGGEPFLIKNHFDFLEKCIKESSAQKMELEYNSNLTLIPQRAWDLWKHFKLVKVSASLDGWGKINDLIRYPSQWSQLKKNLDLFNTAEGSFSISFAPSISVLNVWHLPDFIQKLMEWNFKRCDNFYSPLFTPHPVHQPRHLNINILEGPFKEQIVRKFDLYKKKISEMDWSAHYGKSYGYSWDTKIRKAHRVLESYKKYLYKVPFSEEELKKERSHFIYTMDKLDQIRNTKWSEVLPELYESSKTWRNL